MPGSLTHLWLFCFKTSSAHGAGVGARSQLPTAKSLALLVCEWKAKLLEGAACSVAEGVRGWRERSSRQFQDVWFARNAMTGRGAQTSRQPPAALPRVPWPC